MWDGVGRPNVAPKCNRIILMMVSMRWRGVVDETTVDGAGILSRNSVETSNNANVHVGVFVKDSGYVAAKVVHVNQFLGNIPYII